MIWVFHFVLSRYLIILKALSHLSVGQDVLLILVESILLSFVIQIHWSLKALIHLAVQKVNQYCSHTILYTIEDNWYKLGVSLIYTNDLTVNSENAIAMCYISNIGSYSLVYNFHFTDAVTFSNSIVHVWFRKVCG